MTTYYVAPDGSDGDSGGSDDPLYSLVAADGAASSGDVIVVGDGVYEYDEAQRVQTRGVTIRAADGASPALDWGGAEPGGWGSDGDGAIRVLARDVTIDGLTVRNSPFYGIQIGSSGGGATIRNVEAHHNHLLGIGTYEVDDVVIEDSLAHHNNGSTSDGGDSDGFQIRGGSGGRISNCAAWANGDDGFDLWKASNVLVEHSVAYDHTNAGGNCNGFKMGGGGDGGNNTVRRCAAWNNSNIGFSWNDAGGPTDMLNNTSFDNDAGFWVEGGSQVKNNVSYRDGELGYLGDIDESNNSWNLGIDDPGFVSTDPSSDGYLRLADDSACIDAGVDVGIDYTGDAPDLGCHERTGTSGSSSDGPVYYHDGSGWQPATTRYHDGSGWRATTVRYHDGSEFA